MPFEVSPDERIWLLSAAGAVVAWFGRDFWPRVFGGRKSRLRMLEEENQRLRASLSQVLAVMEVQFLALELPNDSPARHSVIERGRRLAEESKSILNIGGNCPRPEPEPAL
jgi:hypothetical protein